MSPIRFFGIVLLALSAAFLLWGFWPVQSQQVSADLSPEQMQIPADVVSDDDREGITSGGLPPAVPEMRTVTLEYPFNMRQGDADVIILSLDVDQNGATATAQFGDHTTTGTTVEIPNVYDTYSVQAEARLDLLGTEIAPSDTIVLSLQAGQKATFIWTVKPKDVGNYRGAVWLSLNFTPLSGGDTISQQLYTQAFEIDVLNLLGIGGQPARIMGAAGALVGTMFTIEKIPIRISGSRRNRRSKKRK